MQKINILIKRWGGGGGRFFKYFMNIFLSEKLVNVLNTQILYVFLKILQRSVNYMYFMGLKILSVDNDLFI